MANIKSSAKRAEIGKVREARNKANRTRLKTTLKRFDAAVVGGDKTEAAAAYTTAVKTVDKAAARGLLHKNNAARKKSSLTRRLDGMA
ncbi:MAG: 30S ribosomal protein S20 [Oscillospiraceae bacterium]|nr:30S ribosomal protein S20 [Oscillospiraceae bacterium]